MDNIDVNVEVNNTLIDIETTSYSQIVEIETSAFGLPGDKGDDGDQGEAATITIGTVSSVPYTSPATVTNVGTPEEAIFNFEIPQGVPGSADVDWDDIDNKPLSFIPSTHASSHARGGSDALYPAGELSLNTISPDTTGPVSSAYWDTTYQTWAIKTSSETTLQLGQELPVIMHNGTGSTILNGTPVRIVSGNGYPIIEPARADDMEQDCTVGITTQDIASGGTGFVTCFGIIHSLNTSAFSAGDEIYLGATGGITKVIPVYPNAVVHLGHIISSNSTTGSIFVDIVPETFQKLFDVMSFAGVVDPAQITLTYESGTRTLSVAPSGSYWAYFYGGHEYRITETLSLAHTNTTGIHFFYLNSSGVFTTSTISWDILSTVPLVAVYYNATTGQGIAFNERHKVADKYWHQGQHNTIGSYYVSGLAASDYTPLTDTNSAIQFGIASGIIRDEDIANTITGQIDGATYNLATRIGANGNWEVNNGSMPYHFGTYAQYNQWTGTTWQLTEVGAGNFFNVYVLAVPALDATKTVWCVQGQQVYPTLATATGATFRQDIQWGAMPVAEFNIIHRFTFRCGSSYTSSGKARIESYADMRGTTTSIQVIGGGSTTHNALAGLNTGDYIHLTASEYDNIVLEAPMDTKTYGRKDGDWTEIDTTTTVWGGITGSIANQIDLSEQLAGKEPVIASKGTAFNKNFGTGATDVTVGNDSRLSDARAPLSHDNTAHSTAYASETTVNANSKLVSQISSTGLISGCLLSVNDSDPAKYDMTSGVGVIIDAYTDPANPTRTVVNIPARTGLTPEYIATDATSYVFANSSGALVYNNYGSTPEDRRDLISIGWIDHTDNATINSVKVQPLDTTSVGSQLNDFFISFGPFNVSGNVYGPTGSLQILRSAGETFDSNANYENDRKSPHILTTSLEDPCDIYYYYRDGVGDWVNDNAVVTNVDPNYYDDGSGTLASVPSGNWTIQVLAFYAQTLSNDIQYGQTVYASKEAAKSALQDAVDINPYNSFDTFRGWLIVKQGATDLTNTAQAEFIAAGKLGLFDVASGGGTGGEVNTASNIGTSGTGIYHQKVGVDLQFKNIAASGVLSLNDDGTEHVVTVSHADNSTTRHMTDTEKTKLSGIEAGAQVNTVTSVNSLTGAVSIPVEKRFTFVLHRGENATTGTNKTNKLIVTQAMTITKVFIAANTAPTGAALICDINKNSTSIWASTQANRIQLASGSAYNTQSSFDTTALVEGDILTIDIDQVGSTVAGSDITVELRCL